MLRKNSPHKLPYYSTIYASKTNWTLKLQLEVQLIHLLPTFLWAQHFQMQTPSFSAAPYIPIIAPHPLPLTQKYTRQKSLLHKYKPRLIIEILRYYLFIYLFIYLPLRWREVLSCSAPGPLLMMQALVIKMPDVAEVGKVWGHYLQLDLCSDFLIQAPDCHN